MTVPNAPPSKAATNLPFSCGGAHLATRLCSDGKKTPCKKIKTLINFDLVSWMIFVTHAQQPGDDANRVHSPKWPFGSQWCERRQQTTKAQRYADHSSSAKQFRQRSTRQCRDEVAPEKGAQQQTLFRARPMITRSILWNTNEPYTGETTMKLYTYNCQKPNFRLNAYSNTTHTHEHRTYYTFHNIIQVTGSIFLHREFRRFRFD